MVCLSKCTLTIVISILMSGSVLFAACGSKSQSDNSGQVSPDIINNPASASGNKQEEKMPKFEFDESSFDFGTIKSGDVVTHEFKFKNVGDADLVISQAKGSCGCTEPEYSKAPLKPGESSILKVTFNSDGMAGQLAKTVTVLANTIPNTKVVTISAEVVNK